MKKLLLTVAVAAAVVFTGCSTKEARPEGVPEKISTYYTAPLMQASEVKKALTGAGFEILGEMQVDRDKKDVIIFTHEKLKALANKPTRGYLAGTLRVLVNEADKELKIHNPLYYIKANLQDEYTVGDEKPIMDALFTAFSDLTPSEDKWPYDGLADYHFMTGMPYFQEQVNLAEASSVDELVQTAKKRARKNLVYELKLDDNRVVMGFDLSRRAAKFPAKVGADKYGILPWNVLIEMHEKDGKKVARATTLDAKYHIAISYPLLDLGGFASIMTVPGAIEKDLKKYFK